MLHLTVIAARSIQGLKTKIARILLQAANPGAVQNFVLASYKGTRKEGEWSATLRICHV